jgi:hypothetical protein
MPNGTMVPEAQRLGDICGAVCLSPPRSKISCLDHILENEGMGSSNDPTPVTPWCVGEVAAHAPQLLPRRGPPHV